MTLLLLLALVAAIFASFDSAGRLIGLVGSDVGLIVRPPRNAGPGLAETILVLSADPLDATESDLAGATWVHNQRLDHLGLWLARVQLTAGTSIEDLARRHPLATLGIETELELAGSPFGALSGSSLLRRTFATTCGRGVRIGMIDGPLDLQHVSLRDQPIIYRSFVSTPEPSTPKHHGTAIASLLVGTPSRSPSPRLLPEASLVAANIFRKRSDGRVSAQLSGFITALDWILGQGVEVVNLSLTTPPNEALELALWKATANGLVMVAAAGNTTSGPESTLPAIHPSVIAVTAIDWDMQPYEFARRGAHIDFAAPGVRILTAAPLGESLQSGTSFAAPFAAAMAAQLIARGTEPSFEAVVRSLLAYTEDIGAQGRDPVFGWGSLQPERLTCLRQASGPAGRLDRFDPTFLRDARRP